MVRDAARSTSYIRQEKYTTIRLICRSQMIQPRNAGLKPICVCGSAGRKQPKSTQTQLRKRCSARYCFAGDGSPKQPMKEPAFATLR